MTPIPDEIRRFVLTSIPSVPYLEAALLLRGNPDHRWTVAETAARLYIAERGAADLLDALCAAGMAECESESPSEYRYAPRSLELARTMDALAEHYRSNLLGITNLIHDATQKNARRFADAFRLRKDS